MPTRGVTEGRNAQGQMQQFIDRFMALVQQYGGDAGAAFRAMLTGGPLAGDFTEFSDELRNFRQGLPGRFSNLSNLPPELQGIFNNLLTGSDRASEIVNNQGATEFSASLRGPLEQFLNASAGPMFDLRAFGEQMLGSGGYNSRMDDLRNWAAQFMQNGGYTDALTEMENTGRDLMNTRGRTPQTGVLLSQMNRVLQSGGRDAGTQALSQRGAGILDAGGFTPQMTQLMSQIQGLMQSGGMTPQARRVFERAMGIVDAGGQGGALLPMEQVQSFARDAAATAYAQRAQAARRQAMQRRGDAMFSGTEEQALAEFADEAAQAEAGALREATMGQQDLQLKQFLASLGISGDVSKSAQALLAQLSGAGADITRSASANMNTGAGLMSDAERIAAQRFGMGIEGYNSALAQELERMNLGARSIDSANRNALMRAGFGGEMWGNTDALATQRLGLGANALGTVSNIQAGAGDAMSRLALGEQANLINAMQAFLGNNTAAGGMFQDQQRFNLSSSLAELESWLRSMDMSTGLMNQFNQNYLGAASGLNQTAGLWAQAFPSLISGYGNISSQLIQAAMQPSWWERLANSALQGAVGGLTGGFSNMLTRTGTGGGQGNPFVNSFGFTPMGRQR